MKTVLLLGAGSTLAHAQSLGAESKYLPPLDADLFERARILDVKEFDDVRAFVKTHFGFRIEKSNVSAEHVFSLLQQLALDEPCDSNEAEENLHKLRHLYLSVIAECTNKLSGNVEGVMSGLLELLLEDVRRENLCIVTFNYDLIVEKTLAALSKALNRPDQLFSIRSSYYGVDFKETFAADRTVQFYPYEHPEVIQVLKPHGSLNWFLAYKDADDFDRANPPDPVELWCNAEQMIRTDYENLDYFGQGSDCNHPTFVVRPLIVPPVFDKAKYWANILAPIWTAFGRAVSEADRLVICGYSLPDADVKAQCVIAGALAANKHLKRLDVIDTNPSVCNRFVQKTCIHALNYYDSIGSFLEQKP